MTWRFREPHAWQLDTRLLRLLEGIERFGSLREAARKCGVSYRHAWSLIQDSGEVFGQPLAILQRRRGAALSALGTVLLRADREVRRQLAPHLEAAARGMGAELRTVLARSGAPETRMAASHSVAVLELRRLLHETGAMTLELQLSGSLDSLALLERDRVAIAGFHVPHGEIGAGLKGRFAPYLAGHDYTIVRAAERSQGLIQRADGSARVTRLAEIASAGLRFVNRQSGSGTRLIIDQLMAREELTPDQLPGYEIEEFTHFAVAALIAGRAADVGIGVAAAAAKFELAFTELVRETYFLALSNEHLPIPSRKLIVQTLSGSDYAARMRDFAGYYTRNAGECLTVEELLQTIGQ